MLRTLACCLMLYGAPTFANDHFRFHIDQAMVTGHGCSLKFTHLVQGREAHCAVAGYMLPTFPDVKGGLGSRPLN